MNIGALLAQVAGPPSPAPDSSGVAVPAAAPMPLAPGEVNIATFCGYGPHGEFLISFDGGCTRQAVVSAVGLQAADAGRAVVVAPLPGHSGQLAVLARVQAHAPPTAANLKLDGERIVLHAERDIEMRCGEASIVLTRAGKVLIKGEYVLTRSRGANRIKGAHVDIN